MPNYDDPNHTWLMPASYDGADIPEAMRHGLAMHILYGWPVGSFLTGLLMNDLRAAVGGADDVNILLLPKYVMWVVNNPPAQCWGSQARVVDWQNAGGMVGLELIDDPQYSREFV